MNSQRILKSPSISLQSFLIGAQLEEERKRKERLAIEGEKQHLIREAASRLEEAKAHVEDAKIRATEILHQAKNQAQQLFAQAESERNELLEKVRIEAEEIRETAKQEGFELGKQEGYDQGYEEGHQKGYREGHVAGTEKGESQFHGSIQEAKIVAETIATQRENAFIEMEPQIIQLAFCIASKIIHTSVRQGEAIRNVVRDILQLVAANEKLCIHISSADVAHLQSEADVIFDGWPVEIQVDDDINPGGCLVTTQHGYIDAQINEQLERIEEILDLDGRNS